MNYQYKRPEKDVELVEVTVPSGNVFLFEKPSRFGMLFQSGQLPTSAANLAVESWQKDGIVEAGVAEDQAKLVATVFNLRDKVLRLSHTPKLVVGEAYASNELSTDDVTDDDLEYLFKWVSAGGDVSVMLTMFPDGSQPSALASASRPKVRKAAK